MSAVLVSGYSTKLLKFELNEGNELTLKSSQEIDGNPTFSAVDSKTDSYYAVHELKSFEGQDNSGGVTRWTLSKDQELKKTQSFSSGGTEPAHLALIDGLLWATNYGGGSLTVFSTLPDGSIGEKVFEEAFGLTGSGTVSDRQEASHLHGAFGHKDNVYVVDLGNDCIVRYKVEGAKVTKAGTTKCADGSGPRHVTVDGQRELVYLMNELVNSVSVLKIKEDGSLDKVLEIPYEIPGATSGVTQYGAGIEVHPSGKFLYFSNRGDGAMVAYKIVGEDNGYLSLVGTTRTAGTWPRHFAFSSDGNMLLVPDQLENKLEMFSVDAQTGALQSKGSVECPNSPSMITIL